MALRITGDTVPEGAIQLTEDEAIYYQWHQLRHWPNRLDPWPVIYGVPAISFFAGFCGLRINRHYRQKLKLRHFGAGSTRLVMSLTPLIFSIVPHYVFVTQELFIDKQCLLCLQTRAIGIQIFSSTIYPVVMSPIANFMFATRHGTYALPYWTDFKGTIELWLAMNKTLARKLIYLFPIQIVAAGFITYMEARHLCIIKSKIENGEVEYLPEVTF